MRTSGNQRRYLSLFQLIAATFFMVSGGPYGLEDLVKASGYAGAMLILVVTPLIWSLPTALMVGELSSAIPDQGGYYAWVKKALGPFWGFQEAWLSLVSSIFDMAIYPTLFVAYLTVLVPSLSIGHRGFFLGVFVVALCALWNLRGAEGVGRSSVMSGLLLLSPFAAMVVIAFLLPGTTSGASAAPAGPSHSLLLVGILVAMWNYMGWDNASTIAEEVENPQRTYPLAMGLSLVLIIITYVLTVGAAWYAHIDPQMLSTGGWAVAGKLVAGRWLEVAVVIGGCVSTLGTFNSLVLSYTRVPTAMAQDRLLPAAFLRKLKSTGAPYVSILVCSIAWALSLTIGFQRLVVLDIVLYGASLVLEFVALAALRIKQPGLVRPFKVPGGKIAAVLLGIPPFLLLLVSAVQSGHERLLGMNALLFSLLLAALGLPLYWLARRRMP